MRSTETSTIINAFSRTSDTRETVTLLCRTGTRKISGHERFFDTNKMRADGLGQLNGSVVASFGTPEARDAGIHGDRLPTIVVTTPARGRFHAPALASVSRFELAVHRRDAAVSIRQVP